MTVEEIRAYCAAKKGIEEGFPFGPDTLVIKVGGKMFCLCGFPEGEFVNLKCDPDRALELRASNPGITPGYHMSKQHWNSVSLLGEVPDKDIKELIDHSYTLVVNSLPRSKQQDLTDE